jgi:DNA mismatch repair ATPase MutS
MIVKLDANGEFRYYYTLKKGISRMRGGVEILKKMNYPEEILRDIVNGNAQNKEKYSQK